MSNISKLTRLLNGVQRQVDFSSNTFAVDSILLSGTASIDTAAATSLAIKTAGTAALTIDSSQKALFSGQIASGAANANTLIAAGGGTNPLTGTSQRGYLVSMTGTAAATASLGGYQSNLTQAAGITTANTYSFFAATMTAGAGSTITRHVDFLSTGSAAHPGTNNASLADGQAFTGNWFINQSGTDPSVFAGALNTAAINASGKITVTNGANGLLFQPTTGTNSAFEQFVNTGGTSYFGVEGSSAAGLSVGTSAYDLVIVPAAGKNLRLAYNGGAGVAQTIDSSGNTVFSGSVKVNNASGLIVQNGSAASVGSIFNNGGFFGLTSDATNASGLKFATGTSSVTALTIDNSQNATFAGSIASGQLTATLSANSSQTPIIISNPNTGTSAVTQLSLQSNNAGSADTMGILATYPSNFSTSGSTEALSTRLLARLGSLHLVANGSSSNSIKMWTGTSPTLALTLDGSQNATFAGNATLSSVNGYITTTSRFGGANNGNILFNNSTSGNFILAETAANVFTFGTGAAGAIPTSTLDLNVNTKAATFAGTASALRYSATSSSAGSPAYAISTNAGMYNIGTNIIGFSTASTEAMRIDASQNVSILNGATTLGSTTANTGAATVLTVRGPTTVSSNSAGIQIFAGATINDFGLIVTNAANTSNNLIVFGNGRMVSKNNILDDASGNATFTGTLTSGNQTISKGSTGNGSLTISSNFAGLDDPFIKFENTNAAFTARNWVIGVNYKTNGYMEFLPSTADAGTTYSSSVGMAIQGSSGFVGMSGAIPSTLGATNAQNLVIGEGVNNINTGVTLQATAAGASKISFNRAANTTSFGSIIYTHSGAENLAFSAAQTEIFRITGASHITKTGVCTQNFDTSSATSGTITASANTPGLRISGAGGTTLIIKLPSSPVDGQQYWVASQGNFTTVTWQDAGATAGNVIGGQASLGGTARGQRFVYVAADTKWYSIG